LRERPSPAWLDRQRRARESRHLDILADRIGRGIPARRGRRPARNIARGDYDRLKAILDGVAKPGARRLADPAFPRHLEGRIGRVAAARPARGRRQRARYDAALALAGQG